MPFDQDFAVYVERILRNETEEQRNSMKDDLETNEYRAFGDVLEEFSVSAAISRQSADLTRGRFYGQEVVDAARMEPTDADYMSDEDAVAVYVQYDDGPDDVELAMAERLMKGAHDGSLTPIANVNQLSLNDPKGIVRLRYYEVVKARGGGHSKLGGEWSYRLSLQPQEGLNNVVTCAACVALVQMKWHRAADLYTLDAADERALDEWLATTRQQGSQAATLSSRTSRAAKRAQKAQRKRGQPQVAG